MPISPYVRDLRAKVGHDLLMFPSVSAVVVRDDGAILLGQRADNLAWSLPSGMLDPGEQPAGAIVREVLEETGVDIGDAGGDPAPYWRTSGRPNAARTS